MQLQNTLVNAVCAAALLIVPAIAACGDGGSPQVSAQCGGLPNLDKAREIIETSLDFEVLIPTFLPATTSANAEPTINLPDEISILFPSCPDTTSGVLGPQIVLDETTQLVTFPEPGQSDPPTERVQVQDASVLLSQGGFDDTTTVGIDWHQAGLSISATFMWTNKGGPPPEITPEMKAEALRVVESIVEQGEVTEPGQ
jgi:hypothetical protein